MINHETDILIIGGGLTGLTLAYFLKKGGLSVQILEARDRLGGRIHTLYNENHAPIELGATWLGQKHTDLVQLLEQLDIEVFKQELGDRAFYEPISTSPPQLVYLPPNNNPSYRIKGGSSTLIQALANRLKPHQLLLNQVVKNIDFQSQVATVTTQTHQFTAKKIISTLPPYLLLHSINITPQLPAELTAIIEKTHTWMGASIKVALTFDTPFWRTERSSGTLVSNVGPIPELYDHSNVEDTQYALKGFLNGTYYAVSKQDRLELVLKQLRKYYNTQIDTFSTYEEMVWSNEPYTFVPYQSHVLPHQNNGHAIFQQPFFNQKLYIAGSETATQFPGYMNGAVSSAATVAQSILSSIED